MTQSNGSNRMVTMLNLKVMVVMLATVFNVVVKGSFLHGQKLLVNRRTQIHKLSASRMPPLDSWSNEGSSSDPNKTDEKKSIKINKKYSVDDIRKNLELKWSLMASTEECDLEDMHSCGGTCEVCSGEGSVDCRFCGGTGFFLIGNELMEQGKDCPICSGDGEEKCKGCMGSGWIAKWNTPDILDN